MTSGSHRSPSRVLTLGLRASLLCLVLGTASLCLVTLGAIFLLFFQATKEMMSIISTCGPGGGLGLEQLSPDGLQDQRER